MRIWHKLISILLIPIAFELLFAAAIFSTLLETERASAEYERSKDILLSWDRTESVMMEAMSAVNTFSGDNPEKMRELCALMDSQVKDLLKTSDQAAEARPELRENLKDSHEVFEHLSNVVQKFQAAYSEAVPDLKKPLRLKKELFMVLLDSRPIFEHMHKVANTINALAPAELASLRQKTIFFSCAGLLLSIIISVVINRVLMLGVTERIKAVKENAHLLALEKPLNPPLAGGDEIGELDRALHEAALSIAALRLKEQVLLEHCTAVICSIDERLKFTAVSEAASRVFGLSADDMLGRSLLTMVDQQAVSALDAAFIEAAKSGRETELETKLITRTENDRERKRDILWKISYQRESSSFYCVAQDITERRQLQASKQELLANASREVAVPLQEVSETINAVASNEFGKISESAAKALSTIKRNIEKLHGLVDDLLELERLETGKITLKREPMSAAEALNHAAEGMRDFAAKMGVTIEESAAEEDLQILADSKRLHQVLVNLISNACKYSPPEGAVVLSLRRISQNFVELSVQDSGMGIEERERELIFEKFYQTKSAEKSRVKSSGLGLASARALTEAQGGSIGVDSKPGAGSRFWVCLPIAPGVSET